MDASLEAASIFAESAMAGHNFSDFNADRFIEVKRGMGACLQGCWRARSFRCHDRTAHGVDSAACENCDRGAPWLQVYEEVSVGGCRAQEWKFDRILHCSKAAEG